MVERRNEANSTKEMEKDQASTSMCYSRRDKNLSAEVSKFFSSEKEILKEVNIVFCCPTCKATGQLNSQGGAGAVTNRGVRRLKVLNGNFHVFFQPAHQK